MSHLSFLEYIRVLSITPLSPCSSLSPKNTLCRTNEIEGRKPLIVFPNPMGYSRDGATNGVGRPWHLFVSQCVRDLSPRGKNNNKRTPLPFLCYHLFAYKQLAYTTRNVLIIFFCNTRRNKSLSISWNVH